jgi:hypothetical protein
LADAAHDPALGFVSSLLMTATAAGLATLVMQDPRQLDHEDLVRIVLFVELQIVLDDP